MLTSAVIDQVYSNVNRSDLTRAMILQYLNNRQLQVCNFDNFSFMEETTNTATVDGTQSYALPSTYKDELQTYLVNGTKKKQLIKWVGSEAENGYTQTTEENEPTSYWVWDDKIWLHPIPDKVYTLTAKYYQYLPDLTDVAVEENTLVKRWSDLMINGATSDSFHYFLMADKTAEWETKWQGEFAKLVRREGKKKVTNYNPRLKLRIK
jgi:hypothetical protein